MAKTKRAHPIKIVMTGGPSAGKTTVAGILRREFGEEIAIVPEAASILFQGGIPREETVSGKVFQQRAIYFLQRELEDFICAESDSKLVICDRGSLDGLAYWPKGSKASLFDSLGTSLESELKRYDWVIHLDTAGADGYKKTSVRRERFEEAQKINKSILDAWAKHAQRIVIPNSTDFSVKIHKAIEIIMMIMKGKTCRDICRQIQK